MANRKATMTDLRVIVREFVKGTPLREIERKLKISRTSLRAYKERAESSGKSMQELFSMEDADLYNVLVRDDGHRNRDEERYRFMQENIAEYAQRMTRKYMTYEVLYEEYSQSTDNPYSYTQFKLILQEWEKNHDYKYHNVYEPARYMQFDFAGDSLWVVDESTGECKKATVLVCLLPFSMVSYAVAMLSTSMENTFNALSKALAYFGGVPEISKTDNMTQWVKRYDRYEPKLNEAATQWCLHNGTELDNCRVRKPRDKGPAEGLVGHVYKYYYSRVYHEHWSSLEALNNRLMELNDRFNGELMKGRTYSRMQKFMEEEQPYLLPLPPEPYRFKHEKRIKIRGTYHFQIERHFYSVPYQYVGKDGKVVYDDETVEVWVDMQRIATHKRVHREGYSTIPEHMPENHRAYTESKEYNAAYFLKKARQIGPETAAAVDNILKSTLFVQQSYRSCQGVLRLVVKYGAERVEAACRRIEPKSAATYSRIRDILEKNLDTETTPDIFKDMAYMPVHDSVRGAAEYV